MPSIGIIANPASGKDIRRLVSYATTIDNYEKVNIVKRVVLAAQSMGIDEIFFMPDTFQMGRLVMADLERDRRLTAKCTVLDIPLTASLNDTTLAASEMERMGAGCCIVLGGDGTSRAAAKGIKEMPLLPLSTGTNNAYPTMTEGTIAGMAAAAAAQLPKDVCCIRDKRIEVSLNDAFVDIALVDAVISNDLWVGSKAIWDAEKLQHIIVARCHPASIGFSSIGGCLEIARDTDDFGYSIGLGLEGKGILAPIAAGMLTPLFVTDAQRVMLDSPVKFPLSDPCMVALDGEREVKGKAGDILSFTITRNGPWRVRIRETLEEALRKGFYARN